ncbi:hypothetical protein [Mesorhizobium sp. DCY119]|uniref:hypothetical protein n=1 Tax=Mesorhizobium sp. DCY119 TaxID=2108445 RepID=UPI000E6C858C|nr:hypothetical protein [Mesorhizobium sp. DCY119]RJG45471.1 hypothetical protein D3Y55_15205 [Mesorhizobium sp. DCY119]
MKIDLDRGVHIRRHQDMGGMHVYMYADTPGVYLNEDGVRLPEAIAEGAGYPVAEHARARLKKERMDAAIAEVEAQLDIATEGAVLAARGGYQVLSSGANRAKVIDDTGALLTPVPIPHHEAMALLALLVPEDA